ncbi:MAG TPA: alpha/beta hydrolase [Symbiobacteriaceae bacterium]
MRERTGNLSGQGGLNLFYRVWEAERPVGNLVLSHGMNEHSGRYSHVARYFTDLGLTVWALDHRGHGRSEGTRCHVDRFGEYLADLRLLVEMAGAEGGKPLLLGHSMGGLIAFRYAVAYPETLAALVLTSPLFQAKVKVDPIKAAIAPLMARLLPRLQMPAGIAPESVSRDPEVVKAYAADPLVGTKATPRWYTECMHAAGECAGLASGLKLPALFLQAGGDLLVDPEATRQVYNRTGHDRKSFKLYADRYHEILNDPGKEEVLADISHWLRTEGLLPQR